MSVATLTEPMTEILGFGRTIQVENLHEAVLEPIGIDEVLEIATTPDDLLYRYGNLTRAFEVRLNITYPKVWIEGQNALMAIQEAAQVIKDDAQFAGILNAETAFPILAALQEILLVKIIKRIWGSDPWPEPSPMAW